MSEEIKNVIRVALTTVEQDMLNDYITNLQEKLKSANASITWWNNRFNAIKKENEQLKKQEKVASDMAKDYFTKNKKAIEYVERINKLHFDYSYEKERLLNILNGGDDNGQ